MKKTVLTVFFVFLIISLLLFQSNNFPKHSKLSADNEVSFWENQLNELNFIVTRISAINLIYGLNLNKIQIQRLLSLQKNIDVLNITIQKKRPDLIPEINSIRNTYNTLTEKLLNNEILSDAFVSEIFEARLRHSNIIKKSIKGKTKIKHSTLNCVRCHALPQHFPNKEADKLRTRNVSPWYRKKIDLAHVVGMFGDDGNFQYWNMRNEVFKILNNEQKNIVTNFSFCLIPPSDLSDPMRSGQAFSNEKWVEFLISIRSYDNKTWRKNKHLYLQPLESLTEAILPGITPKKKNKVMSEVENILNHVRTMDDITFDLQKEPLCKQLNACFDHKNLTTAVKKNEDIVKYTAAMLLLFPGNTDIYSNLLSQ